MALRTGHSRLRYLSIAFGLVGLGVSLFASRSLLHPAALRSPALTLGCLAVAIVFLRWPALSATRGAIRTVVFGSKPILFNTALGICGAATFAWLSFDLFNGIPHLDDSVAALFSAKVFLSGRITVPMPAHPEFFHQFGVLSAVHGVERLAGMYPPGWSLILVPGVALGVSWLINPLLGGALAVTTTALGGELYDRSVGRLAGILVVCSPMLGAFAATHLSHLAAALLVCLCWWATIRAERSGRVRYGLIAGAAMGLAILTRPATAAIVGLVVALPLLSRPRLTLRRWRPYLAALSVVALFVALLASYQHAATGSAWTAGHQLELGENRGLGWVEFNEGEWHTPARAVEMTLERLRVVDTNLLGWPLMASSVFLVPFLLGVGGRREIWLLTPYLALMAFFATFWYFPEYYPGRYLTAGLAPLLIACAGAWRVSSDLLREKKSWHILPSTVVLFGLLFSIVCGRPEHFARFGPHHGDVETVLPALVERLGLTNALVFVGADGKWDRDWDRQNDYYASGFRLNTVDRDGDVVYARNLGAANEKLIAAYPDRSYYVYTFRRNTLGGDLYRRVRGRKGTWFRQQLEPPQRD